MLPFLTQLLPSLSLLLPFLSSLLPSQIPTAALTDLLANLSALPDPVAAFSGHAAVTFYAKCLTSLLPILTVLLQFLV